MAQRDFFQWWEWELERLHRERRQRARWRRLTHWFTAPRVVALPLGALGLLIGYGGYLTTVALKRCVVIVLTFCLT